MWEGGSQKSSVAYVQCINTVCSWPTLIIFVVEFSQSITNIHFCKTALLMSCVVGVSVLCSRSYKHSPTVNQDVLSQFTRHKMIYLPWPHSLLPLCSILKRSFWFHWRNWCVNCVSLLFLWRPVSWSTITAQKLPDHMEAMIVDLEIIYRTNPLLNAGHTPCHLHRNHSQITPCKKRRLVLTLAHFCYTPKNKTVTWDFTYAFSLCSFVISASCSWVWCAIKLPLWVQK